MKNVFPVILLSLSLLSSIPTYAEQKCKHPPPQPIPSDTSSFKICAEILSTLQKGAEITLTGWSGWIYNNSLKESHTKRQSWTSNVDGHLGYGEKISIKLSPGTHTITLTHDPGVINYELKTSISITVKHNKNTKNKE